MKCVIFRFPCDHKHIRYYVRIGPQNMWLVWDSIASGNPNRTELKRITKRILEKLFLPNQIYHFLCLYAQCAGYVFHFCSGTDESHIYFSFCPVKRNNLPCFDISSDISVATAMGLTNVISIYWHRAVWPLPRKHTRK